MSRAKRLTVVLLLNLRLITALVIVGLTAHLPVKVTPFDNPDAVASLLDRPREAAAAQQAAALAGRLLGAAI